MRVVLDTNVLISALITDGKSRRLLYSLFGSEDTLLISQQILDEFLRITAEERLSRYIHDDDVTNFLRLLLSWTSLVVVRSRFRVFDSPDDDILRTARDGRADVIVSGDVHLLDLKVFRGIRVVSVAQTLEELRNRKPG